jgi:hypothetical protein
MDLFYMNSYNSRNLYLTEVCFNMKLIVDVVLYYINSTLTEITSKVVTKHTPVSPSLHNRFKQIMVCYFGTHFHGSQIKPSRWQWNACFIWVLLLCPPLIIHPFIHSVPLPSAECDNLLPFTGASSIPLLHTLSFHPFPPTSLPSSLTSCCYLFLGLPLCLVVSKVIYNTFLGILFSSILCTCPNQRNLFNLNVSVIVGFLCYVWVMSTTVRKKITSRINTADCQDVFRPCEVTC